MTKPKLPPRQRLAIIAAGDMRDVAAITKSLESLASRGLDFVLHDATPGAAAIACSWARHQNLQRLAVPKAPASVLAGWLQELERHGYAVEAHIWGEARAIATATRALGIVTSTHQLGASAA